MSETATEILDNMYLHQSTLNLKRRAAILEVLEEIDELKKLFKEASDYLDTNNLTSIGHGSILHTKFKGVNKP